MNDLLFDIFITFTIFGSFSLFLFMKLFNLKRKVRTCVLLQPNSMLQFCYFIIQGIILILSQPHFLFILFLDWSLNLFLLQKFFSQIMHLSPQAHNFLILRPFDLIFWLSTISLILFNPTDIIFFLQLSIFIFNFFQIFILKFSLLSNGCIFYLLYLLF